MNTLVLRPDRLTNMAEAGSAAKGFIYTAGAAAYQYDLNGNLTQDNHKGLSIQYNYLNLPNYISNAGGADITLTYTADGEKLSKISSAGTRNYVSGIEYLGANLEAIYHGEGRCTPNGATVFYYEYTIKDHLGNARVNFRANGAAVTFLQELHYYPFGKKLVGGSYRIEVWIKPLSTSQAPKGKRTEHSNTVVWIRAKT